MSLPKLSVPQYRVTLPISQQELTVRPFLMKEEKVLMMAFESGDAAQIVNSMAQVIQDCITEEINIYDLPMVDAEYLLIKMKSYSRGETIDITMRCNNTVEEGKCGNMVELNISLENMEQFIDIDKAINNNIELGDKVGVKLRPPRFNCLLTMLDNDVSEADHILNVLADSIESVWTDDEVFPATSETVEELQNFIGEMDAHQFGLLKDYFASLPEIKIEHDFECPKCNHKEVVSIRDLNDFFV
jgi:hypothetical protein